MINAAQKTTLQRQGRILANDPNLIAVLRKETANEELCRVVSLIERLEKKKAMLERTLQKDSL